MNKILSLLVLAAMLFSATGCATSTKVSFYTDVEGADVYIDNVKIGQTPILKYKMKNKAFEDEWIIIRKEGYKEISQQLPKEVKVANAIGGYIFLIPLLWAYGPKPEQHFLLTKITEQ